MRKLCAGLALLAMVGQAEAKISTVIAAEAWNDDDRPAHGVGIVAWDKKLADGKSLAVVWNTETIQLTLDGLKLSKKTVGYVDLKGEALRAGLLADHFVDGKTEIGRTFNSSYLQARTGVKTHATTRTWIEFELGARRWFFSKVDDSADALTLPANTWVFEPRLRFTFWDIADNRTIGARHRFFPRVRGFATGFELGADYRSETHKWGAVDESFDKPDTRNDPAAAIVILRQWALVGWQLSKGSRLQIHQSSGIGRGEDDLTRARIGGMNPYVVTVPGSPWAAWLSEEYVGGVASMMFGDRSLQLGPMVGAVAFRDTHRSGSTDLGTQYGAGGHVDWAIGDSMPVDFRGGYSPSLAADSDEAAWSAWVSFGWANE